MLIVFRLSFFFIPNRISYFEIQNPILTLEIGPNIVLWHSKSYFDIRTWDEYHIVTFKILFWHSNWGPISYFDIQYPILTFKIEPNIVFWHWKILFRHSISDRISYFDIQNPTLTLKLRQNIVFYHLKSYSDIQLGPTFVFWHSNSILTLEIGPNIVFWHSKSYFVPRNRAKYPIFTFTILFWHSNWGRICYFDIKNPILTFKIRPNIVFSHSKSYFDIRTEAEYRILTFKILFWHSK